MITLTLETIAEVCHEANRVLQHRLGEQVSTPWDQATDEMKDSYIDGVKNALVGASPRVSHENWIRHRREHGWKYGDVKDEKAKTHPNLVPYHHLPVEQQLKDKLFVGIVKVFQDPI